MSAHLPVARLLVVVRGRSVLVHHDTGGCNAACPVAGQLTGAAPTASVVARLP